MALTHIREDVKGDNGARESIRQVEAACGKDTKRLRSTPKLRALVGNMRPARTSSGNKTK